MGSLRAAPPPALRCAASSSLAARGSCCTLYYPHGAVRVRRAAAASGCRMVAESRLVASWRARRAGTTGARDRAPDEQRELALSLAGVQWRRPRGDAAADTLCVA